MKTVYISDLGDPYVGQQVIMPSWLVNKRNQGKLIFLDVCDSTGKIQAVIEKTSVGKREFESAMKLTVESGIIVHGQLARGSRGQLEIRASRIELVGDVTMQLSPRPREGNIDIFDPARTDHLMTNRHLYLRNPKVMAIMRFRDVLMRGMREWFHDNRFISIDAPILTPVPLYDDATAIGLTIADENVHLTQCAGYYLEAAVHAFERVYNIGPSFRGEESHSKRHLMEYWHIKAELTWGNLDNMMTMVEDIVQHLTKYCHTHAGDVPEILGTKLCMDGLGGPYPRISYDEVISRLQQTGRSIEFGKSLGSSEEEEISKSFDGPFWITGIPRTVEPFPYVIDPEDARITRVADLIASKGYGELLGTAEKISNLDMLDERMQDKGKAGDPRYEFIRDVHRVGCVPHIAFGMGVERFIRWLLDIPHVRDAIPFPRVFRRKISP